jgi:hypothetical protein
MIIYAATEGTVIYSDNKRTHKAGRVPLHEPLTVIKQYLENWFKIDRPANISLPEDPNYPNYWVHREQIIETIPDPQDPPPEPDPENISDFEAAAAIVTLIKYLKQ